MTWVMNVLMPPGRSCPTTRTRGRTRSVPRRPLMIRTGPPTYRMDASRFARAAELRDDDPLLPLRRRRLAIAARDRAGGVRAPRGLAGVLDAGGGPGARDRAGRPVGEASPGLDRPDLR